MFILTLLIDTKPNTQLPSEKITNNEKAHLMSMSMEMVG